MSALEDYLRGGLIISSSNSHCFVRTTMLLRSGRIGYELDKGNRTVNYLLFMDYLRFFMKSADEISSPEVLNTQLANYFSMPRGRTIFVTNIYLKLGNLFLTLCILLQQQQ